MRLIFTCVLRVNSSRSTIIAGVGGLFSLFLRHFCVKITHELQIGGRGVLFIVIFHHHPHTGPKVVVFASFYGYFPGQIPNRGEGGYNYRCFSHTSHTRCVLMVFCCVLHCF